jgi:hypothetical protein
MARDRGSKKRASRYEAAERLATAQRVSVGVADTGINQAHSQIGKGSQIHAGPYSRGLSQPSREYLTARPAASGLSISHCAVFVAIAGGVSVDDNVTLLDRMEADVPVEDRR